MARAKVRFGLPLGGINKDMRVAIPAPSEPGGWSAVDIAGYRFDSSRSLRPFPTSADFANTPDTDRITRLHNILWGDGTADLVRHTHTGFDELVDAVWTARNPAAGFGASTAEDYWGAALVPSVSGKGLYMFSNRVVGPFTWTGGAVNAANAPAGSLPARHICAFADRAMIFNLLDAGNVTGRTGKWSVPGDSLTWTGTGSGDRDFMEFEGEITGAAAIRRNLFVYARNSIIAGVETFQADSPVSYTPVISKGIGIWAPNSLLTYNDIHAFLSEEGFKVFDGQQIIDIGAPIDGHVLSRITRSAANRVCGFVKPDWHVALWAVPMDGSATPNVGWLFDFRRRAWLRIDLSPYYPVNPTAFVVVTNSASPSWNDAQFAVPWTDASMAGKRWIDFSGEATEPTVVSGHDAGTTRVLDESTTSATIELILETPDFTWEGTVVVDPTTHRGESPIGPDDIITLDEVEIVYRTIEDEATLFVLVSIDGGRSYTPFGSTNGAVTLSAQVGDRVRRVRVNGRRSGTTIRVKITSKDRSNGLIFPAKVHLEDIIMTVRKAGEVRGIV